MDCLEINEAIKNNLGGKANYLGCFLADDVRKIMKKVHSYPVMFIINTLDSGSRNKMGHWLTFYVDNKGKDITKIVILDSYANHSIGSYSRYFDEFISYFQDYELYMLKNRIQSLDTYFCGNYIPFISSIIFHAYP